MSNPSEIYKETLPKLLSGFYVMVGMAMSAMLKRNMSSTFPFLTTIVLDSAGLKRIRAHTDSLFETLQNPPAAWDRFCGDCEVFQECHGG
ncbi:hypothetical protein VZT92_010148 [Zoarces viviparus]|uniref:Uncharacterized protein n=1 Tax=Zoarces viviparus TaxID=48416 RepID=A0AAW1FDZ1_ZOAVI